MGEEWGLFHKLVVCPSGQAFFFPLLSPKTFANKCPVSAVDSLRPVRQSLTHSLTPSLTQSLFYSLIHRRRLHGRLCLITSQFGFFFSFCSVFTTSQRFVFGSDSFVLFCSPSLLELIRICCPTFFCCLFFPLFFCLYQIMNFENDQKPWKEITSRAPPLFKTPIDDLL